MAPWQRVKAVIRAAGDLDREHVAEVPAPSRRWVRAGVARKGAVGCTLSARSGCNRGTALLE